MMLRKDLATCVAILESINARLSPGPSFTKRLENKESSEVIRKELEIHCARVYNIC